MAIFKTNLEVMLANEAEIELYYQAASEKINLLLKKYNICNAENTPERISVSQLRALLSFVGFFQSTPLKSIFFDQKQQFVPQEIVVAFRDIISESPLNIKAVFFNTFIMLLTKKGWDESLSVYFEKHYGCAFDEVIILEDLKDYSLGWGVYRATFQLRAARKEKVTVFLKQSSGVSSCNELLYFHLQKELLSMASDAKPPCSLLSKTTKEELLLSPLFFGLTSDAMLSMLMRAYKNTHNDDHRVYLKKTLEILIEEFICHAVLGDLFGRNDRHLMNSLMAFVLDGMPQKITEEDFNNPEKFLVYAKNIAITKAISLVDIDLKWLLNEKNFEWILIDIDFGLSELNLLSLLPEFNDYDWKDNAFFEQRKKYIKYYFNWYCQKQVEILEKQSFLFSAVQKNYPADMVEEKLLLLCQRIKLFEKSKESIVILFKRYLLDFRIRLAYKSILLGLSEIANETKDLNLLNALKETDLMKYLPSQIDCVAHESSVLLQLQCFRGVLSKKDRVLLSKKDGEVWETVATNISIIAGKYNSKLFETLKDKKQFIQQDTVALLQSVVPQMS